MNRENFYIEKIKIMMSDYSLKQIQNDDTGWAIGDSNNTIMRAIHSYENDGYKVVFKRCWNPFIMGKYKVLALK